MVEMSGVPVYDEEAALAEEGYEWFSGQKGANEQGMRFSVSSVRNAVLRKIYNDDFDEEMYKEKTRLRMFGKSAEKLKKADVHKQYHDARKGFLPGRSPDKKASRPAYNPDDPSAAKYKALQAIKVKVSIQSAFNSQRLLFDIRNLSGYGA